MEESMSESAKVMRLLERMAMAQEAQVELTRSHLEFVRQGQEAHNARVTAHMAREEERHQAEMTLLNRQIEGGASNG